MFEGSFFLWPKMIYLESLQDLWNQSMLKYLLLLPSSTDKDYWKSMTATLFVSMIQIEFSWNLLRNSFYYWSTLIKFLSSLTFVSWNYSNEIEYCSESMGNLWQYVIFLSWASFIASSSPPLCFGFLNRSSWQWDGSFKRNRVSRPQLLCLKGSGGKRGWDGRIWRWGLKNFGKRERWEECKMERWKLKDGYWDDDGEAIHPPSSNDIKLCWRDANHDKMLKILVA